MIIAPAITLPTPEVWSEAARVSIIGFAGVFVVLTLLYV